MIDFLNGLSTSFVDFWHEYFGVAGFEFSFIRFIGYYILGTSLISFFLFLFRKLFIWGD